MIFDEMLQQLKNRSRNGETNQEIADSAGMSQSRINYLLHGSSEIFGKVSLENIMHLFPSLVVAFPNNMTLTQNANSGNILNGGGNITVGDNSEYLRKRLTEAIIDADLPPESKVQVLKVIKDTPARPR